MRLSPTYNLAVCYPEIAAQWDRSANGSLRPEEVGPGSKRKAGWKCPVDLRHKWVATIKNRSNGSGCPCCAGQVPSASHNLLACFPEIASQWHPTKNGDMKPEDVLPKSGKKHWWLCSEGHEWEAVTSSRTSKDRRGCPYCAGQLPTPTHNLAFCYPEISAQWDCDVNGDLLPCDVLPKTDDVVGWICKDNKNHRWSARVADRTGKNSGCPVCSHRRSKPEIEIFCHVLRIYQDTISNDRKALCPSRLELDVFVPSICKAIEYDGTYWHKNPENVIKDRLKDDLCVTRGIQLLRITDIEYLRDKPATLLKIEKFLSE